MATLDKITINVPSEVAEAYFKATKEEQEQIQLRFTSLIQLNFLKNKEQAIQQFRKTMDEASKEAQSNGLTPEILEFILQDNE